MEDKKKISLVIPVYNRADVLRRTLDYVAGQDTRDFSLILVDNNSQDDTLRVITEWTESHKDIDSHIYIEKTPGAAAARNCGLRNVATEYVMFFDSDDFMAGSHISSALKTAISNPDADVIGWDGLQEQPNHRFKTARFSVKYPMRDHLIFGTLSTFRYAIKTDFLRKVGGWNEKVRVWDDYELGVRILLGNPEMVKRSGEKLVRSFYGDDSLTANKFSGNSGLWEYPLDLIEGYLKNSYPSMLPWIDYRRAVLAAFYKMEGDDANARRLLDKTISSKITSPLLIKLLYYWHLKVKTGAWIIASLFLPRR